MSTKERFPYSTEAEQVPFAYEITERNDLQRVAAVEFAAEALDGRVASRVQKYSREVKLPGFRPGKVPAHIIRQRFGDVIRAEVLEELIKEIYPEVLKREEKVAGVLEVNPTVDPETGLAPVEGAWHFTIRFEVAPEVVLKKYKKLRATAPESSVEDHDVDEVLDRLRKERSQFVDKDAAAARGDYVDAEYRIYENGVEQGDKPHTYFWQLGDGGLHNAVDEALIGAKTGEERISTVTFAQDDRRPDFAGRTLEFVLKVSRVADQKIPPLDDAFAADVGPFENVAALRDRVRESLQQERTRQSEEALRRGLLAALRKENPVALPTTYVERLQQSKAARMLANLKRQGMVREGQDKQYSGLVYNAVRGEAEADGHDYYLLGQIADENSLVVSAEEIEEELLRMAAGYNVEIKRLKEQLDREAVEQIKEGIRNEKAYELVKESARIDYVKAAEWAEQQAALQQTGQGAEPQAE